MTRNVRISLGLRRWVWRAYAIGDSVSMHSISDAVAEVDRKLTPEEWSAIMENRS